MNQLNSAVFIDPNQSNASEKVVGIVLRDFALGEVNGILKQGEQLVRLSLSRKTRGLRNCPAKMAPAGYTCGSRSCKKVVGWARSIAKQFSNQGEHDEQVSSLFGLFYALV